MQYISLYTEETGAVGWEGPLEKKMATITPVFLPGKSYDRGPWWDRGSLVSPWDHERVGPTQQLKNKTSFTFLVITIGHKEGGGNTHETVASQIISYRLCFLRNSVFQKL